LDPFKSIGPGDPERKNRQTALPADILTASIQSIWLAFGRTLTYYIPSKFLVFYAK
jgi:hypothetical protein